MEVWALKAYIYITILNFFAILLLICNEYRNDRIKGKTEMIITLNDMLMASVLCFSHIIGTAYLFVTVLLLWIDGELFSNLFGGKLRIRIKIKPIKK